MPYQMLIACKIFTRDESGVLGIIVPETLCRDGAGVSGITVERYAR